MKVHLDCIPCFQRQALQAARFVTKDEKLQEDILRAVIKQLQDLDWGKSPPDISHTVHKIVRDMTGAEDPYRDVKKHYNDIALEMYPKYRKIVEDSPDPLLSAVRLAIAGNVIDFGASSRFDLTDTIKKVMGKDFSVFHYSRLKASLGKARTITFLSDNTGEIVFDRILLETIYNEYDIEKTRFGVKGAPIINDATVEDAVYVGIDDLDNVEFININVGPSNTGLKRTGREFQEILNGSDTIISKGQGNYEALSENESIFFMLIAKCPVIASDLGVDIGDIILKGRG